jgi:hypothetical protein
VVALSLGGLRRQIEALMMPDEVEIVLQLDGHPAAHPELVIAVMNAASSDWAAARLGVAIERVAEALLVEEEAVPQNGSGIVRATGLVRRDQHNRSNNQIVIDERVKHSEAARRTRAGVVVGVLWEVDFCCHAPPIVAVA